MPASQSLQERQILRCALLSVSDKTGIVAFARSLQSRGVKLLSTGGTADLLSKEGVTVIDVSSHTNFPELMDGRVKTLHPVVHGGILGREGTDDTAMREHGIEPIDLVCVNLYPFEQVVKSGADRDTCIENIDIGGPSMLRSAAKNFKRVAVVSDPEQYDAVLAEVESGGTTVATRTELAARAFATTDAYDAAIAAWFAADQQDAETPATLGLPSVSKSTPLRYGENPNQKAVVASFAGHQGSGKVISARQLQGKELSYNNYCDADAAWRIVSSLPSEHGVGCVIVKHANPCGAACADDATAAYQKAFASDPLSAFGGIIAFGAEVDAEAARAIVEQQFVEVVVAPDFSTEATEVFARKKNVRLLACGALSSESESSIQGHFIDGGVVLQEPMKIDSAAL